MSGGERPKLPRQREPRPEECDEPAAAEKPVRLRRDVNPWERGRHVAGRLRTDLAEP